MIPDVNLISNLGFGPGATHTHLETSDARLPLNDIWEVNHPQSVIRHCEADAYSFDHSFGGLHLRQAARGPWEVRMDRVKGLARRIVRSRGNLTQ